MSVKLEIQSTESFFGHICYCCPMILLLIAKYANVLF